MIRFSVVLLFALSCGKQTNPKPNFLDSKKVPEKKEQEEKPEEKKEIEECLFRVGRCAERTGDYIEAKCLPARMEESVTRHRISEVCDIIPCYKNRDSDCIEESKRYVKTLIYCCLPTE